MMQVVWIIAVSLSVSLKAVFTRGGLMKSPIPGSSFSALACIFRCLLSSVIGIYFPCSLPPPEYFPCTHLRPE